MKRIAILGGGIGGLTVAHALSKFPEYQIAIYEAKDTVGGMARSSRDNYGCATEYCWRVFFGFYDNLLKIMSEIPIKGGTALDNLTPYKHINLMNEMSLKDRVVGYFNILLGLSACDQRLDSMDGVSWWEALGSTSDSNLFRHIGGWLGMDRYKGSYRSVIKVGIEQQIIASYLDPSYKDFVSMSPTSEALFDPWTHLLRSRNVHIYTNTKVTSLILDRGKITGAMTSSGPIRADYFVLGLPIDNLVDVLATVGLGSPSLIQLRDTSLHMQLSFQLYFNKEVSLGDANAFLVVESPWDLIVLSYDSVYQTEICKRLPDVKGAWSVAATTAYVPGILYGKTLAECSEDEIKEELWAQLYRNPHLQALVRRNNTFEFNEALVVRWADIWPTYDSNGVPKGETPWTRTSEPKFTNNAGTFSLRPPFKTKIPNLFIATAYTRETIDIFSMEAAAISGLYVANAIDGRVPPPTIRKRPAVFSGLRYLDSLLWPRAPNIIVVLLVVITTLIFLCVLKFSS